jgi:hypothetical protein
VSVAYTGWVLRTVERVCVCVERDREKRHSGIPFLLFTLPFVMLWQAYAVMSLMRRCVGLLGLGQGVVGVELNGDRGDGWKFSNVLSVDSISLHVIDWRRTKALSECRWASRKPSTLCR